MNTFELDLQTIRQRARDKMRDGAVTGAYKADKDKVINVLNEALATEITCVLRYKNHALLSEGLHGEAAKEEFLEHAAEEQEHADVIAERIVQLGGMPEMNPEGLHTRAHAEYSPGGDLLGMIRENLVAERIAVETYTEIIRWLGDKDPTTRKLMEEILETEEEHADDMAGLLERVDAEERVAQA